MENAKLEDPLKQPLGPQNSFSFSGIGKKYIWLGFLGRSRTLLVDRKTDIQRQSNTDLVKRARKTKYWEQNLV